MLPYTNRQVSGTGRSWFPKRYAPASVHCARTGQDGGASRAPPVRLIGPFLDVGILEAG
jgi:hypothetical protein